MREFLEKLTRVFLVFSAVIGVLLLRLAVWLFLRPAVCKRTESKSE